VPIDEHQSDAAVQFVFVLGGNPAVYRDETSFDGDVVGAVLGCTAELLGWFGHAHGMQALAQGVHCGVLV
jgi:hypothetical protein